jgi:hypothetical protein
MFLSQCVFMYIMHAQTMHKQFTTARLRFCLKTLHPETGSCDPQTDSIAIATRASSHLITLLNTLETTIPAIKNRSIIMCCNACVLDFLCCISKFRFLIRTYVYDGYVFEKRFKDFEDFITF